MPLRISPQFNRLLTIVMALLFASHLIPHSVALLVPDGMNKVLLRPNDEAQRPYLTEGCLSYALFELFRRTGKVSPWSTTECSMFVPGQNKIPAWV